MDTVHAVRKLGFRKWYERELTHSHAHLVLLLLSAVAMLASLELYTMQRSLGHQFRTLACAFVSAAVVVWSLRRYLLLLMHAQYVAGQAVCRHCDAFAKFDLLDDPPGARPAMSVRCRRCQHRWVIDV